MSSIMSIPVTAAGLMGYGIGKLVRSTTLGVSRLMSRPPSETVLAVVTGTQAHQRDIAGLPRNGQVRIERDAIGSAHHTKVYIGGKLIGSLPDQGKNSISKILYTNFTKGKKIMPRAWFRTGHGSCLKVYIQIDIEK